MKNNFLRTKKNCECETHTGETISKRKRNLANVDTRAWIKLKLICINNINNNNYNTAKIPGKM